MRLAKQPVNAYCCKSTFGRIIRPSRLIGVRSDLSPKIEQRVWRCETHTLAAELRQMQPKGKPMNTGGGEDVFAHATLLERAGLVGPVGSQKVAFDTQENHRISKITVGNIQTV